MLRFIEKVEAALPTFEELQKQVRVQHRFLQTQSAFLIHS